MDLTIAQPKWAMQGHTQHKTTVIQYFPAYMVLGHFAAAHAHVQRLCSDVPLGKLQQLAYNPARLFCDHVPRLDADRRTLT